MRDAIIRKNRYTSRNKPSFKKAFFVMMVVFTGVCFFYLNSQHPLKAKSNADGFSFINVAVATASFPAATEILKDTAQTSKKQIAYKEPAHAAVASVSSQLEPHQLLSLASGASNLSRHMPAEAQDFSETVQAPMLARKTCASAATEKKAAPKKTALCLPAEITPGPFQLEADFRSDLMRITEKIGKGECLSHALGRLDLQNGDAQAITKAASELADLNRIRPGSEITVFKSKKSNHPLRLEFDLPGQPPLIMIKTPTGFAASTLKFEKINCLAAGGGKIKSSLWGSAVKLYGLSPEVVSQFTDIFRYDIDFLTEVQSGSSFSLLFEKSYCLGNEAGSGRILAAEFINKGHKYSAFYWEDETGKGHYYDANGRSLRKMFQKSPLQYRRISSYFSKSRMHPILKYRRPHLGVDYAAPRGTPVETIGGGIVTFIGHKGGYGKMVIVKHGKKYVTQYAHLSKYAKGLRKGHRVRQGQLIGYVGSTGLSTGPHLDFRVKENGKYIDPLSLKSQPAEPLTSSEKARFMAMVAERRQEMARLLAANQN